jgi:hypothetical protein
MDYYDKYVKYKNKYLKLKIKIQENGISVNNKKILRIVKPYNTKGLDADSRIFYNLLSKEINNLDIHINTEDEILKMKPNDDIHIYISNTSEEILKYCKIKIFMINHELFHQKQSDLNILKELDYVIARNNVGFNWANKIKKENGLKYEVKLIKFTSDFPKLNVEKNWNKILHSAGEHHWKQTDAIIKCWKKYNDLPEIIITCTDQCYINIKKLLIDKPKNVIIHNSLIPMNEFIKLKNEIGIHLCPSIVEGYGHYINEARKLKSLVITSDLAPMNELINDKTGILIKCDDKGKKKNGADLCFIKEESIYKAVKKAMELTNDAKDIMIEGAYNDYISDENYFKTNMVQFINNIIQNL